MGLFASAALAEEVMVRCVAYGKVKKTIAIIKDTNNDKGKPNFSSPQ